jgi:hypothetical protein
LIGDPALHPVGGIEKLQPTYERRSEVEIPHAREKIRDDPTPAKATAAE